MISHNIDYASFVILYAILLLNKYLIFEYKIIIIFQYNININKIKMNEI